MPFVLFSLLALFPTLLYRGLIWLGNVEAQPVTASVYLSWLTGQIFSQKWFEHIKVIFDLSWIAPLILFSLIVLKKPLRWPLSLSTKNLIVIMIIPFSIAVLSIRILWYSYFIPVFLLLIFVKVYDDLMPDNSDKRLNYLLALGFLSCLFVFLVDGKDGFPFPKNPLSAGINHYIIFPPILGIIWLNIKWTYKNQAKALVILFFFVLISHVKMISYAQPWISPLQESFSRDWLSHKYQGLFPIMRKIFLETNWTPKKAMKQIHVIGIRDEISLLAYYAMAREKIKSAEGRSLLGRLYHLEIDSPSFLNPSSAQIKKDPALHLLSETPTGYIIIQHLKKFSGYSQTDWKRSLSHSLLLSEPLRREITEKKILIKTPQLYNSYWLIPYIVTKKSIFVDGFHNTGQPYYWEWPEWLKHCGPLSQHFQDKSGFYYCKVLPGKGFLARAGIHIQVSEGAQKKPRSPFSLNINFFGPLIGSWDLCSALPCPYMRANRMMSDIKINLLCNNVYFRYEENIMIGNDDQGINKPGLRGQRFTAPLKLSLPLSIHCKKDKIRQIELTFNMGGVTEKVIWKK